MFVYSEKIEKRASAFARAAVHRLRKHLTLRIGLLPREVKIPNNFERAQKSSKWLETKLGYIYKRLKNNKFLSLAAKEEFLRFVKQLKPNGDDSNECKEEVDNNSKRELENYYKRMPDAYDADVVNSDNKSEFKGFSNSRDFSEILAEDDM
ncbi:hypothetical protein CC86DRAFT_385714 [Ophiobolus disseminans]|uniref:Uncharacterized protein n=1 Tax=Ophiobolus disseminans TaxID=1469910 RepID=A0A6A6ZM60_9PLEO|nr:hypothetical protein CC86DRAFT_385714 [Ophiobolus disseminans]